MGFGQNLQGRISHEALIKVQDTEIKILENIKRCIALRVESDRQYATALSKMVTQANKVDCSEFSDTLRFIKVWENMVVETECLTSNIRDNADTLATRTLETMTSVINEKKNMKRFYLDERNRLETEFNKLQADVQKLKIEYSKTVERLKAEKAKYQDLQSKGKGGSKLEDAKTKCNRTAIRLHRLHNDYVLALQDVVEHQKSYLENTLPSFLEYQQAAQELLVLQSKFVLEEYHKLTNFSTSDYQRKFDKIGSDIDSIVPETEYTSSFIGKYKSEPIQSNIFEFDERLIDSFSVSLQPGVLEVDDVTIEPLQQRKTQLSNQMNECQKSLEIKTTRHKSLSVELNRLETSLAVGKTAEVVAEFAEKKKEFIILEKEMAETESNLQKLQCIFETISKPLDELGDSNPPPVSNLLENGDLSFYKIPLKDTSSTLSTSSQSKKKTFLNYFRKQSDAQAYSLDNNSDSSKKKLKQVDSYEQHELNAETSSNGSTSLPVSPSKFPENATGLLSLENLPARLQDDECFHGVLPREEVQRLLVNNGDYLIRESKNKKTNEVQHVLSVFWEGHKHFIIQGTEGAWRFEGQAFRTISELIRYQHSIGTPVTTKSQAILRNPIKREAWELVNDDIQLEMKIGNGNFGEVYKGIFRGDHVVAVKTCKDTLSEDQRKKFLQEGRILKQYDHPNIVEFIGIAASRQPVMIVMEFVSGGALLTFLRKQGKSQSINKKQLIKMCVDAACGMAYLESKGCIHRDLAARNCLVGDQNIVKISDFGMSREEGEYHVSQGMKQIPIKWTAPEALNFGIYTTLCDIWSYSILMWEIFSFGVTPYTGSTNAQAREKIEEGYRMPAPAGTPDEVYEIMKRCWEYEPEKRPHFQEIYSTLSAIWKKY